jgi:multidrug efflux system outer membrane protein
MKKTFLILSAVLMLMIVGCSVGPDFQRPQVDTMAVYQYDTLAIDTMETLIWWELFDDSAIDSLVRIALEQNQDLLIAASRVEEARAALTFTGADRYPQIDIQAGANRGNFMLGQQADGATSNYFIAPVLSWEIDFWGKFARATESARAQLMANEYSLRSVQIGLIAEVISTYYQLLDYNQRLVISKETLESREKSLDIIRQRFEKGVVPEIDLNQSQIQREIAAAAIPFYERLVAQTENALNILLGYNPGILKDDKLLITQSVPPDIPVGLPSHLLERRPDIARAEYTLMAQNAQVGVAVAQRFPSISLTGLLGLASNDLSTLADGDPAWAVSGGLLGPIFNWNKNIARVEIEEARTQQALYEYEKTVLNAFREVEDALIGIDTYNREVEAKRRQFTAAANAADLSSQRYDQGVTSYLEVLETQRSAFNAALELSATKKNYLDAYVKLYKALGGGWLSEEEMESVQKEVETEEQN